MDIRGPYTEHAENAMHGNLMSLLNWRAIDIFWIIKVTIWALTFSSFLRLIQQEISSSKQRE